MRQYLTVSSYDQDVDNEGAPRVDLNAGSEPTADSVHNHYYHHHHHHHGLWYRQGRRTSRAPLAYLEALHRNKIKLEQPADLLEAKGKLRVRTGKKSRWNRAWARKNCR